MKTSRRRRQRPAELLAVSRRKQDTPQPHTPGQQTPEQQFEDAVRLHQSGQVEQADRIYTKLLAIHPSHAGALHLSGLAAHRRGDLQHAAALIRQAIVIEPGAPSFHTNLGNLLLEQGSTSEAVEAYRRALALEPRSGAAWCNLGFALLSLHRRTEALECARAALKLLPDSPEALTNKASVLLELGRIEEAVDLYELALRLRPGYLAAMINIGTARLEQGNFQAAIAAVDRALTLSPGCAEAELNRSVVALLLGDFAAGWRGYEARQRTLRSQTPKRGFPQAQWRGEPLAPAGKAACILLHTEQGLGDSIQFLRYVPLVTRAGGQVLLEVPAALRGLADSFAGIAEVFTQGEPLPAFDWHCPLMSLPLAFETRLATIPAELGYLRVLDEDRLRAEAFAWPRSDSGAGLHHSQRHDLRVGLVWAGTPDHPRDWARSLPLAAFAPVLSMPGVDFFSLQVGPAAAQHLALGQQLDGPQLYNLDLERANLADTAAKILQLDLVIAADTAVAHLAGALGKPVWLLLPAVPDWRWLLDREDSPWYPSMRLFRQHKRGEWDEVVARLRIALGDFASDRTESTGPSTQRTGPPAERNSLAMECSRSAAAPAPLALSQTVPCKICAAPSELFGVVDFHKSCAEAQGRRLRLSGIPVYYHRCGRCGFLFTGAFDVWSAADFAERIYNRDYALLDPDFAEVRPAGNARLVAEAFAAARQSISILDYGGGAGRFVELLRGQGFSAANYDPFSGKAEERQPPPRRFDLITCFEVMEHAPNPVETLREMNSLLEEDGLILFSTLLQPKEMDNIGLNWWYAGPRNGHCSLYSAESLVRLFASAGLKVASCNQALHLAHRRVPAFAAHLKIGPDGQPSRSPSFPNAAASRCDTNDSSGPLAQLDRAAVS